MIISIDTDASLIADVSVIPFALLPFQQIILNSQTLPYLAFTAPCLSLVVPFLQLIALHEGHIRSAGSMAKLYDQSIAREPSWIKRGEEEKEQGRDLRRALMQLEFDCQWGIGDRTGGVGWMDLDEKEKWKRIGWSVEAVLPEIVEGTLEAESVEGTRWSKAVIKAESQSFCDAFVERRIEILLEVRIDL
jgi:hypothetical protein